MLPVMLRKLSSTICRVLFLYRYAPVRRTAHLFHAAVNINFIDAASALVSDMRTGTFVLCVSKKTLYLHITNSVCCTLYTYAIIDNLGIGGHIHRVTVT